MDWILIYFLLHVSSSGRESFELRHEPMASLEVCLHTKKQLQQVEYKDRKRFTDVDCKRSREGVYRQH